ncbi:STAS domain-containing protein [Streptomyces sp. NPDC002990]
MGLFETAVERADGTVLISAKGDLDGTAGPVLQQALEAVTSSDTVALIDVHAVRFMDAGGLLLFLDLHRRAECLGLRVLVVGWQAQPQGLMASVAGIPGAGSRTGERYALAGFRRLIEERAERQRDRASDQNGSLSLP